MTERLGKIYTSICTALQTKSISRKEFRGCIKPAPKSTRVSISVPTAATSPNNYSLSGLEVLKAALALGFPQIGSKTHVSAGSQRPASVYTAASLGERLCPIAGTERDQPERHGFAQITQTGAPPLDICTLSAGLCRVNRRVFSVQPGLHRDQPSCSAILQVPLPQRGLWVTVYSIQHSTSRSWPATNTGDKVCLLGLRFRLEGP